MNQNAALVLNMTLNFFKGMTEEVEKRAYQLLLDNTKKLPLSHENIDRIRTFADQNKNVFFGFFDFFSLPE